VSPKAIGSLRIRIRSERRSSALRLDDIGDPDVAARFLPGKVDAPPIRRQPEKSEHATPAGQRGDRSLAPIGEGQAPDIACSVSDSDEVELPPVG
jgi:hypothetical protein